MTANQPKPKLALANGIPVTIALQYPSGKRVPSRFQGAQDQVYYSLTDGRSMYLPLEVGQMIDNLRLRSGEPFVLSKNGPGNWTVERAGAVTPRRIEGSAPVAAYVETQYTPPVNGSGEDLAAILGRHYRNAIGIALEAVEFARAKGLMVTPGFEDLRCIAAALMIQEGGRR